MSENMNGPVHKSSRVNNNPPLLSVISALIITNFYLNTDIHNTEIHTIEVDVVGGLLNVRQDHIVLSIMSPTGETETKTT